LAKIGRNWQKLVKFGSGSACILRPPCGTVPFASQFAFALPFLRPPAGRARSRRARHTLGPARCPWARICAGRAAGEPPTSQLGAAGRFGFGRETQRGRRAAPCKAGGVRSRAGANWARVRPPRAPENSAKRAPLGQLKERHRLLVPVPVPIWPPVPPAPIWRVSVRVQSAKRTLQSAARSLWPATRNRKPESRRNAHRLSCFLFAAHLARPKCAALPQTVPNERQMCNLVGKKWAEEKAGRSSEPTWPVASRDERPLVTGATSASLWGWKRAFWEQKKEQKPAKKRQKSRKNMLKCWRPFTNGQKHNWAPQTRTGNDSCAPHDLLLQRAVCGGQSAATWARL